MSLRWLLWAFDQKVGDSSAKLVLLKLADAANDRHNICWPSIELLAKDTELSERTVQRMLGILCDRKIIARAPYHYDDGKRSTDVFFLDPLKHPDKLSPQEIRKVRNGEAVTRRSPAEGCQDDGAGVTSATRSGDKLTGGRVTSSHQGGCQSVTQNQEYRTWNTEPGKEPSAAHAASAPSGAQRRTPPKKKPGEEPEGFEQWYALYPKHEDRGHAARAYGTARKLASAEILLEGARRYAQQREGEPYKYTKKAATWLNGRCWLDEVPVGEVDGAQVVFEQCDLKGWVHRLKCYHGYFADEEDTPLPKGTWIKTWGPPPHDPKNKIPAEAVSQVRPRLGVAS